MKLCSLTIYDCSNALDTHTRARTHTHTHTHKHTHTLTHAQTQRYTHTHTHTHRYTHTQIHAHTHTMLNFRRNSSQAQTNFNDLNLILLFLHPSLYNQRKCRLCIFLLLGEFLRSMLLHKFFFLHIFLVFFSFTGCVLVNNRY